MATWVEIIISYNNSHQLVPHLPHGPDGEHVDLSDTSNLSTCADRAEPGQKLIPDVLLHDHTPGVDHEDISPPIQVWQAELHIPVQPSLAHEGRVHCTECRAISTLA